jgi:hypothetical protein
MPSDIAFGLALIGTALWLILAYLVLPRPRRGSSAPRPRHLYTVRSRPDYTVQSRSVDKSVPEIADVGQQLYAVMTASFERRRLLNPSEYKTFRVIEADVVSARRGYRVFAQTSLGEVLSSPDESAFRSINSKRVDILIVDQGGWPILAVEHHGSGHYQGTAAARDAIKKEALRKAGVRYVEIVPGDSDQQIRSRVREQLGWKAA